MKLKVAICEDDPVLGDDIKRRILEIKPDYEIDIYSIGESVIENIGYDIVFLDIEMPGRDGLSIAKELREKQYGGHIVFLTSHTEFMPEAFKVKAFRFLTKPIKPNDLLETLSECEREIFLEKKLIVTVYGTDIMINVSDILYIMGKKNRTIICTINETLETNCTLKYWIQELGKKDFFQVHKSYIVSLRHIKEFDMDCVRLHGSKMSVPVSRRNVSSIKKAFFEYVRTNAKYF